MARHCSPSGRHVLETRRSPAHRRTAAETGTQRAVVGAAPARTVAGGALSLVGASAAGWVAATHLPTLLDTVLQAEAASARTVALVALGTPAVAEETPMARLAAVDPAAVAAVATRAGTARSAVASRPAASAPTAGPTPSAPGPTSAERGDSAEDDRSRDRADDRTDGGPGSRLSAAPASPPPSTGGRVADRLPSEIIDTGDWYLTLPTGREGRPDLVEGSALARYHSQFFQLNQARNGVVFTAGTDGATTSGSQYPRSELREMFGSEKASWDGRKGKHTMEIVQAITETPEEKPDVIAGQIHGTSDDLMQVHLSGQRLRVKYADRKKFVDLDPNYRLGTVFTVRIESSGGRVKVWYNGQQEADLPISSSTSYFKAGVYTNSNASKGDRSGTGQVVIRSLAIRHE